MKILIANKFYRPVGGPETVMLDSVRELEARGHEVVPFSMHHPENVPTPFSEYFVSNLDYNTKADKGPKRLVREARELIYSGEAREKIEKLIADTKPDIAHAHNIYHQLSPSILAALKKAGVPTLLTLHDGKLLCANMLFLTHGKVCDRCGGRAFYHSVRNRCVKDSLAASLVCCVEEYIHRITGAYEKNVDLFITPSRFLKDKMVSHGRLKEEQVEVLPNYADVSSFEPDFTPGDYGLFVGRMEPLKGVMTLLRAARSVPDFTVRFAGRGPQLEEGQQVAQKQGLDKVSFLGFQTGENLVNAFRGARFVVLPSECYENCPMVILEAFSAGKPVIASRIGGIPELIEEGVDGFLFEPGDADGLAQCMRRLIDDPDMASRMGQNGRQKVEERYSIEAYMDSLLEIYERLLRRT